MSNKDVLQKANLSFIECLLLKLQLRWDGHVAGMENTRKPNTGTSVNDKRDRGMAGTPWKRYKDLIS